MNLSRRHFFFGSLALPALSPAQKNAAPRPNIVLLVVDNLPAWALGCYGCKEVLTPNIDHLAQTGSRLLHHFSAVPSPEGGRAALLSGSYARASAGPADASPLAKALAGAGYDIRSAGSGSAAEVAAQSAKVFEGAAAGKPFFLTATFSGLREPYDGSSAQSQGLYAAARFESFFPSDPPAPNAAAGKQMLPLLLSSLRLMAASLTTIDEQIGAVVARLGETRLLDATLVVLTSPCGSLFGRHGLWGSADGSDPVNMFEETVSTPMIWRWPRRIPPQTTRPESISSVDLAPALCEIAGIPFAAKPSGRSYLPLITGQPLPKRSPWRNVVFSRLQQTVMVRDSRFKLIERNGGKGPNELYDLQEDPAEKSNGHNDPRFNSVRPALASEIAKWNQQYPA